MQFNSKETYLLAVQEWRGRYLDEILNIRSLKVKYKVAQRAFHKIQGATPEYWKSHTEMVKTLRALEAARDNIRALLEERSASKFESQRQYLARVAGSRV